MLDLLLCRCHQHGFLNNAVLMLHVIVIFHFQYKQTDVGQTLDTGSYALLLKCLFSLLSNVMKLMYSQTVEQLVEISLQCQ